MQGRTFRIGALLAGSGFCALAYQTVWFREMRFVFGMSTAASAAVLAIFMGGLGLGGAWLGRRADRHPSPLALYARLELGVAATAALTPGLMWVARQAWAAIGGTATLGAVPGTVVRLLLAALVLGVPTVLMGGTLPAAARAAESDDDAGRKSVSALYGMNTLGAVTGVTLATFVLLEAMGLRNLLWAAAALNAAIALVALRMAPGLDRQDAAARTAAADGAEDAAADGAGAGTDRPEAPAAFVLAAAATVGFAFFLMELVWYRLLGPILGGSSYTFGLILAVALAGIGLGGGAWAVLGGRVGATLRGFALTCVLEAVFIAIPFALGDRIAVQTLLFRPLGTLGFVGHVEAWTLVAALVVFPASFVSGIQFPLLIALLGKGRRNVGRHTGDAYAWNTAGAIVGSLAGGFGLMPLLTAPGTWRLVAGVLAVLGALAAALSLAGRRGSVARHVPALALAAMVVPLLLAEGPTAAWRHSSIGAGRTRIEPPTPNGIRDWRHRQARSERWSADGVESSLALMAGDGWAVVTGGKSEGNARIDAPTMVVGGLLPALLHPDPRTAFVVGLGTGSSAGWIAAVPSIERVDVAELEPAVLDAARACAPVNLSVVDNPKVRFVLNDAREVLVTSREAYDVVFSEPSNPYRAGVASLFTREFYELVRDHLSDDGLFVQWVQGYEVDAATVRTVIATVAAVFPNVETWETERADTLLVASLRPVDWDVARLRARVAEEPYRTALRNVYRSSDLESVLAQFVAGNGLARAIAGLEGDAVNTDDDNRVEFGFARTLGLRAGFTVDELRNAARALGHDRPPVRGEVDWARMAEAAVTNGVADGKTPLLPPGLPPEALERARAGIAFLDGDLPRALHHWQRQPRAPAGALELALVGDALAEAGDEAAADLADRLRPEQAADADAVLARLRLRQGKVGEAADALVRVFEVHRTDPWPLHFLMRRALALAEEAARRDPSTGPRLYRAVREPFAVMLLEEDRMRTALALALAADPGSCADALGAMEPWVPWRLDLLVARARCYEAAGDPRAARARLDVAAFSEGEPRPFGAGL